LSLIKNSQSAYAFDAGSQNNAFLSRVTWTPFYDEAAHGRYMMHVGFGTEYTGTTDGQLRIRTRGSLRNGISQYWPVTSDTGTFFCQDQINLNPEWALVAGRWHLQAEYMASFLQGATPLAPVAGVRTNQYVCGYYAQVMYFLTGEHREYERKAGAFGRIVPHENFHFLRRNGRGSGSILTKGAWQIGYRFNELNLNSGFIGGGVQDDHTLGLNHFINPNMKIQYNFVVSNRQFPNSATAPGVTAAPISSPVASYGFGIRLAHDF